MQSIIYLEELVNLQGASLEKNKDKVFKDEKINLDFSEYEKCLFENCEIHVTYGITQLVNNDIRNCSLHLHGPASTIAEIIKLFSAKQSPTT